MKYALLSLLTVLSAWTLQPAPASAQSVRNTAEYNLDSQGQPGFAIALKGYDPVSYFPEGGGKPQVGVKEFRLEYMGATYLFASAANADLFLQNPDKYEPAYGGWCAFAMASGTNIDIVPEYFSLSGNRLHLFFSRRAKANFDADVTGFENRADNFWKQISGENPRL
jgi:YHS domain-containing protein